MVIKIISCTYVCAGFTDHWVAVLPFRSSNPVMVPLHFSSYKAECNSGSAALQQVWNQKLSLQPLRGS